MNHLLDGVLLSIMYIHSSIFSQPEERAEAYGFCYTSNDLITPIFATKLEVGDIQEELSKVVGNGPEGRLAGVNCRTRPSLSDAEKFRESEIKFWSENGRREKANFVWKPSDGRDPQAEKGKLKSTIVQFLSMPYPKAGDGYVGASVEVRYQFLNCMGEIHVAYGLDNKTLKVGPYYYYKGRSIPTDGLGKPTLTAIGVSAVVKRNLRPEWINTFEDSVGPALGYGCFTGQTQKVGTVAKLVGPNATREAVQALLDELVLTNTFMKPARFLRNASLESGGSDESPKAEADPTAPTSPAGEIRPASNLNEDAAVRDANAAALRGAQADVAALKKAQEDQRAAIAKHKAAIAKYEAEVAKHEAEVAAVKARNAARAAEYARQRDEADAAQRAK